MLDVGESRELQAALLALKQMGATLRRAIYRASRENIVPEFRQELYADANTHLEERVLAQNARADVTARGVTLKAAQSRKALSGGASPVQIGHAVEFGAPWRAATITTTRDGTTFTYKRVINKQLKPRRSVGHLVWPLAARLAPRFAALWVQTTVKTMYDSIEGKRS